MLAANIYVQIWQDRVCARNLGNGLQVDLKPAKPFSHPRSLVGNFTEAQSAVTAAVSQVRGKGLVLRTRILIQPMETVEGGLTQVEERVLRELAAGAGASKLTVWVGVTLSDEQALARL